MSSNSSIDSAPYLHANKFSRFIHHWVSPLLKKSRKQGTLYLNDLYDLPDHLKSSTLTNKLETNWFNEVKRNPQKPSLIRATLRTLGWKPFLLGFLEVLNGLMKITQPLLLTFLMKFFEPCSTIPVWQALLFAIGTIIASLISGTIFNEYFYKIDLIAAQMRIAYMGLIFRKVLRLSSRSMNSLSSGEITNLISNDAKRIETTLFLFNYIWIIPIEIILISYLFWYFVKYIAFIAIGYMLFLLLLQSLYGRMSVYLRTKVIEVTDERIKIISEIIKSMCIVKMYCWERAFIKKINLVRKHEIIQYILLAICDCIQVLSLVTHISLTFLMMYGTMWSLNLRFDTRFFAIASCILGFMRLTIIEFFSNAIRDLSHYLPARKRIEAFLLLDESEQDHRLLSSTHSELESIDENKLVDDNKEKISSSQVICHLKHAQWNKNEIFSLKNIIFNAYPGDLICVIGPVGSGKSSLLQALTGEISYLDGKIRLHGSFCYVPQEAWIFSSTIKDNILFGKEYNSKLFQRVTHATALDKDFDQLPNGANTLVGDQGVMLSGGQKARVNMARALYHNADIYLLDDPLSAVDAKVSKHLFEKSIKDYLQDKICILVTHQIQFLQDATKIIVLDNGKMIQMGTYVELLSSSLSFARLLEDINQHEEEFHTNIQKQQSLISSIESETDNKEDLTNLYTHIDKKQEEKIQWHVYKSYLQAGLGTIFGFIIIILFFTAQQATMMYSSWWLASWSDDESHRYSSFNNCTSRTIEKINNIRLMNDIEWNAHRNRRFYIYCILVVILFLLSFLRTMAAKLMCLNAGRILHNKMFQRIIRCPINFFDTNPVDRILNRFTNDINIMDEQLPEDIPEFFDCVFAVLGTVALVCILNPWSFIPAGIGVCCMLIIRNRFVQCSRDLKRLDGTTRSPIYSHLTSTIHGLKVIRSYHVEQMCSDEFLHHIDNHTRVHYLIVTTNRWAAIRLNWIAFIFLALVTFLALIVRIDQQKFSTADIALILSYSLNLMGLFQWTVRMTVQIDTDMTSIERILEYCSLDQEPPAQVSINHRPPSNWPSDGRIVYENVSMSYSNDEDAPLALHNLSLTIEGSEKVGIVGRIGAGKSSFIQILFRMGILIDGQIRIDNINIEDIGLDDVRNRISIIPQDPILFSGTIRSNLDPFNNYSDDDIWNALEQVQLKTLVKDIMLNGLDSIVNESGSNLSVGQKQLICLARTILKQCKILVIDEAIANVDNTTDELIQKTIREKFKQCTILTIAHRLRTVIDSDRIMILGNGELLEFDTPQALLSNSKSYFTSLIEQTGSAEAQYLRTLVNTMHTNMKYNKSNVDIDEELVLDSNENDPLLR
ncbi:unnamed protein product [Rotaria sordida]|uniref:Multidrug resistance-associated protein 4-like n=1 Tax=Rotaria sordida TaxID=392033 RepID=A0A814FQX0_9BILA|nr:unnamed protein product [Rotaria sordida]